MKHLPPPWLFCLRLVAGWTGYLLMISRHAETVFDTAFVAGQLALWEAGRWGAAIGEVIGISLVAYVAGFFLALPVQWLVRSSRRAAPRTQ